MLDKFTSTELILIIGALCTGIGGLLATLGTFVLQIINARKMSTTLSVIEETKEAAIDTKATVKVVEGHVNSARTEAATEIRGLRAQIEEMTTERSKDEKIALDLAHAKQVNGVIAASAAQKTEAQSPVPVPVIVENASTDPVPTTKGSVTLK